MPSPQGDNPCKNVGCGTRTPSPIVGIPDKFVYRGRVDFTPPLMAAHTWGEASLLLSHWGSCSFREGVWGHSREDCPPPSTPTTTPPPQVEAGQRSYHPYSPTPSLGHGGWVSQGGGGTTAAHPQQWGWGTWSCLTLPAMLSQTHYRGWYQWE